MPSSCSREITNQSATSTTNTIGDSTAKTPPPVATPLPPRNRFQTGNTWPITAAAAEHVARRSTRHHEARPGGQRALGGVEHEHPHAAAPAEHPGDVGRAGVARADLADVDAVGPGDEHRARERCRPGRRAAPAATTSCAATSGRGSPASTRAGLEWSIIGRGATPRRDTGQRELAVPARRTRGRGRRAGCR